MFHVNDLRITIISETECEYSRFHLYQMLFHVQKNNSTTHNRNGYVAHT